MSVYISGVKDSYSLNNKKEEANNLLKKTCGEWWASTFYDWSFGIKLTWTLCEERITHTSSLLSFHPHTLLQLFLFVPRYKLGTDNLQEPFKQLRWDLRRNTVALTNTLPHFTSTRQVGHASFQATVDLSWDTESLQHKQMLTWDLPAGDLEVTTEQVCLASKELGVCLVTSPS